MTTKEIMNILFKDIHSIAVGTIDEDGHPFTAYMDVMRADETGIYVSTSRFKKLYWCLDNNDYVSLSGMRGGDYFNSQMITFNGRCENIGPDLWEELLADNAYLYRIFPKGEDTQHDVFRIHDGEGDYQDFSVVPSTREEYRLD